MVLKLPSSAALRGCNMAPHTMTLYLLSVFCIFLHCLSSAFLELTERDEKLYSKYNLRNRTLISKRKKIKWSLVLHTYHPEVEKQRQKPWDYLLSYLAISRSLRDINKTKVSGL